MTAAVVPSCGAALSPATPDAVSEALCAAVGAHGETKAPSYRGDYRGQPRPLLRHCDQDWFGAPLAREEKLREVVRTQRPKMQKMDARGIEPSPREPCPTFMTSSMRNTRSTTELRAPC
jgi:hypothetical protein